MSQRSDDKSEPLNNITQEDVAAFVNSLRVKGTPWSIGCAALLTALWAEVEHSRYSDIEHETLGCHVAKTGIYAELPPRITVAETMDRLAADSDREQLERDLAQALVQRDSCYERLKEVRKQAAPSAIEPSFETLLEVGKRAGEGHAAGFAGKCCETTLYKALRAMRSAASASTDGKGQP